MSTYQVRSLEEADQIIKEHERKTKTFYALLRSTKNFGCVDVPACANDENEVRFETVGVPYCGVPFFVAGLKILQCQSFRGRGTRKKKEIKTEIATSPSSGISVYELGEIDHEDEILPAKPLVGKKKKKAGRTHQVGCTATIIMKEVIYYPEFQLYEHSKNNRIAVARQLKDALKAKAQVQKDRIIYVTVPAISDHFGHSVSLGASKNPAKRLYVKNDFYGSNDPGSSKRAYYPVKQEKVNMVQVTKRFKVDEDDTEAKAKEVREMLQSIMALTYKPGTTVAFQELLKDLMQAKLKYQQTMNELLAGVSSSIPTTVNVIASPSIIAPFSPTHQVLTVQPAIAKTPESGTVAVATGWQPGRGNTLASSATVIPGTATVVAVASLPLTVSTTAATGNGVVTVPNPVTIQQQTSSNNGTDTNNQETSIFIEAMEAIFNSQM